MGFNMRLKLLESGIQNIRSLAKEYNKACIFFHVDMDGVCSAIAMKSYLQQYGIKTVDVQPIQYGDMEYAIHKPAKDVLPVLVDFAHGKIFMKIHTDHHESQIEYSGMSKNFSHAKSNAGTISSIISPTDVFSKEDVKVIDMVDSAGYSDENIGLDELKNYIFNYDKSKSMISNHLRFGMVVGKLLGAYKNRPGFLKHIIMNSEPSLTSMFSVMSSYIKEQMSEKEKEIEMAKKAKEENSSVRVPRQNWYDRLTLQKNADEYAKSQENKKIENGSIEDIKTLSDGDNIMIGNCIVQVGGGNMKTTGGYDRYTAFKNNPSAKYFIMIWDSIGIMQVSKNNWNKENKDNNINLGEVVLTGIFKEKYVPLLQKPKYDISLLAIKKTLEEKIQKEDIKDAIGFDYNEFIALFNELPNLSDKQKAFLEKAMKMTPAELKPSEEDSDKKKQFKEKALKIMAQFKIPLYDIVLKTSGGHTGITNLSGFSFLTTQQRIEKALEKGRNPYEVYVKPVDYKPKQTDDKPKYEPTSVKILKSIAQDVVKKLNNNNEVSFNESVYNNAQLNETKPSRFNKHLDNPQSFANISAERSLINSPFKDLEDKSFAYMKLKEWNNKRTKRLEKLLKGMGLNGYFKTKGGYVEIGETPNISSEEKSFFIPNITKEQAIELGSKFDQDSVLFKDKNDSKGYYYYTNTSDGHKIGERDDLAFYFNQGRYNTVQGEFYTRLPKYKHKFSYNTSDEHKNPHAHKKQDFISKKY